MALSKTRLKNKFIAARENVEESNSTLAWERFCDKMAEAIVDEIKELKINYTTGLLAGSLAVTGNITHTTT